ncbi:sensor histidine kinase [Umezawaea sp. Da 62-37]|uniref:sensor histidine kinase n=1 Tax=Umezawaea sp. Da 62-37 TaxID=3075927 RepID=UPI0028F6F371|nr:sensor histidine kinase [Umezawaea sp. Da 62-37]WNV82756.1 sensor histidine kinase [Umezawaea sp. Da 62-37]
MGKALRLLVGLLLGFLAALVELPLLAVAWSSDRVVTRLADLERRRLLVLLGVDSAEPLDRQARRFVAVRALVGLLGGVVLAWLGYGLYWAVVIAWMLATGELNLSNLSELGWSALAGVVLLYVEVQGIAGVVALERKAAHRFLGMGERELLRRRVEQLALSRAGIVEAVDAERRRIERDLHDGVQQRLVALGMLLGRARRNPARAEDLLRQAHEESARVLDDLREVAWRVYPAALDSLGLGEAVAAVADRSAIPVRVDCLLDGDVDGHVETAAYFVVCEAVTNAAKHSGATGISVGISRDDGGVRVWIEDDGRGGADPRGGGLAGLARRVSALDGTFTVSSPAGGPTTITAELPCG